MPKMTKEELQKRKNEMTAQARAEVAKTEIVQFRVDAENISKLYDHAMASKMPIGTMVRQWVLERLRNEENRELNEKREDESLASLNAKLDYWVEVDMAERYELIAFTATQSIRANAEQEYSSTAR